MRAATGQARERVQEAPTLGVARESKLVRVGNPLEAPPRDGQQRQQPAADLARVPALVEELR